MRPTVAFSPMLSVLVGLLAACQPEALRDLEALKQENARLQAQVRQIESDLEHRNADILRLQLQLRDKNAELVASRIGIPSNAELRARILTSLGEIVVSLDWRSAPYTVQNFVTLAEGTRSWHDPVSGQQVQRPLYRGTFFHRVIPDFMIQGGDPAGDGSGGPGYTFPDEIDLDRHLSRAGLLAMANSGPDTNGSQFFITDGPAPHVDGKHTLFGQVISGLEVVAQIARVPRDERDRPLTPVQIHDIQIQRLPGDR